MHVPPSIATLVYIIGIAGLFWLDRGSQARVSKALWIPTIWLMITCSRPVSMWLGMTPKGATSSVYLEGSPMDRAVLMTLVAAGVAVLLGRRERVGPILRKNWPIVLFFAYAATSILWSAYPFFTFKHWIKGIGDVAMVLIVLTEPSVTDAIKRLVTRVGFILLPVSVLLCKYYPDLGRVLTRSWADEYTGVTTQKNSLGGVCLVLGLGVLWCFRETYNDRDDPNRRRRLLAYGAVFGMTVLLLWMCNSMTCICALTMGGAVMLLSTRPAFRGRPARVHVLVVVLLGIALYALFFQSSGTIVDDLGRDPTLSGRTLVWSTALAVPINPVVGTGYESFWIGRRLTQVRAVLGPDANEAHDGYLEIYLNLGWIGVALLGMLVGTGYRNVIRARRRDPSSGSLLTALFLGNIVRALTEAAFRMMDPTWIFFLLAITATPEESTSAEDGDQSAECPLELGQEAGAGVREGALEAY